MNTQVKTKTKQKQKQKNKNKKQKQKQKQKEKQKTKTKQKQNKNKTKNKNKNQKGKTRVQYDQYNIQAHNASFKLAYQYFLKLFWILPGRVTFTKIVRGGACQTFSIPIFCLISHPSVYHF